MLFVPWAIMLVSAIAVGAAGCAAVVVPSRFVPVAGAAGALGAFVLAVAYDAIWHAAPRLDAIIAASFIGVGSIAGGYGLAAALLPALTKPAAVRTHLALGTGSPELRVILLADEEPGSYEPRAVTSALSRYEASGVELPPEATRPLIYAAERARYRQAGGSPSRAVVRDIARALTVARARSGDSGVSVAYCGGSPSLAEEVAEQVADGGRRIVVAALTAAWTRAFDEAMSQAAGLGLNNAGILCEATDPLWASPRVAAMVAERTLARLTGDHEADGVVLVSAGEPWEWDRDYPAAAEQGTFLAHRIRAELLQAGLAPERIRRAWLEWEDPDVPEAIRHLVAVGARRIALVPATFAVDELSTVIDLQFLAERGTAETGASVVVLPAWGADPAVVDALLDNVAQVEARFARD